MNMYTSNPNIEKVRVEAVAMVESGKTTREVARHFGYAQSTIVNWCKKKRNITRDGMILTVSSRPKSSPAALDQGIVGKIIAIRTKTGRCAEVVHKHLEREGIVVSLSSVKRVISRYGLTLRDEVRTRRSVDIYQDQMSQSQVI